MSDVALTAEQRRQALDYTRRRASTLIVDALCCVHTDTAREETPAAALLESVAGHLDAAYRELRELGRLIAA